MFLIQKRRSADAHYSYFIKLCAIKKVVRENLQENTCVEAVLNCSGLFFWTVAFKTIVT